MDFSGKAYILKVGDFKNIDMWVRLVCQSRGVFTGFAFGGRNSKRRFAGCLSAGNHVLYSAGTARRGEYVDLKETVLLDGFPKTGTKASLAVSRVLEIMYSHTRDNGGADLYPVLDGFMDLIRDRGSDPAFPVGKAVLAFRVSLMEASGLLSSGCAVCGAGITGAAPYDVSAGGLLCRDCFTGRRVDGRLPDGGGEALAGMIGYRVVEEVDTGMAMAIKDMVDLQARWHDSTQG